MPVIGYGIFILLFLTALFLVHVTIAVLFTIVGEVNSQLSEDRKINPYTVTPRVFSVLRMHRELFPESKKRRRMWELTFAYSAAAVAAALLFYFLGRE
jgi:hypothetical protein